MADTNTANKFDFSSFDTSVAVPDVIPTAPRANQLPFRDLYTAMQSAALEGKKPHKFVPTAYWTDERGVKEDKADYGYQRGKLRDQFNKWKAEHAEERGILDLLIINRTGKEGIEGIDGPGLSFWILKGEKAPEGEDGEANPAPQQEAAKPAKGGKKAA